MNLSPSTLWCLRQLAGGPRVVAKVAKYGSVSVAAARALEGLGLARIEGGKAELTAAGREELIGRFELADSKHQA
jgi:hypothetical protein